MNILINDIIHKVELSIRQEITTFFFKSINIRMNLLEG